MQAETREKISQKRSTGKRQMGKQDGESWRETIASTISQQARVQYRGVGRQRKA
jgi:hypothetical protein